MVDAGLQVNLEIKQEMYDLRRKGYFGDGFWSAGTRECLSASRVFNRTSC